MPNAVQPIVEIIRLQRYAAYRSTSKEQIATKRRRIVTAAAVNLPLVFAKIFFGNFSRYGRGKKRRKNVNTVFSAATDGRSVKKRTAAHRLCGRRRRRVVGSAAVYPEFFFLDHWNSTDGEISIKILSRSYVYNNIYII